MKIAIVFALLLGSNLVAHADGIEPAKFNCKVEKGKETLFNGVVNNDTVIIVKNDKSITLVSSDLVTDQNPGAISFAQIQIIDAENFGMMSVSANALSNSDGIKVGQAKGKSSVQVIDERNDITYSCNR